MRNELLAKNNLMLLKSNKKSVSIPDDLALLVYASQYNKEKSAVLCNYTGKPLRFRIAKRCKYRIPEWEDRLCGNVDHIIPQVLCADHPDLYDDFMNLQYISFDVNQFDKNAELTLHAQYNATEKDIWHPHIAKMQDKIRRLTAGEKVGGYVPREWFYGDKPGSGFPPTQSQLLGARLFRAGLFARRFPQFDTVLRQMVLKYAR